MDYSRYQEVSKKEVDQLAVETIRMIKAINLAPNPIHFLVLFEALCFKKDEVSKDVFRHLGARTYDDSKATIFFNQLMKQSCFERVASQEFDSLFAELKLSIADWLARFPQKQERMQQILRRLDNNPQQNLTALVQTEIQSHLNQYQQDNQLLFETVEALEKRLHSLERDLHNMLQIAMTDELTGLFNRRGLKKQYSHLFDEQGDAFNLAVLVVDIDFFKKLNDHYGHLIGDSALRFISRYLQQETKRKDVLARYGGEEFVVMLPDTHYSQALAFAEKLRKVVEKKKLVIAKSGEEICLTISIGVAAHEKQDKFDDLFEKADRALYQAKKNGRNQVVGFNEL